jgi:hypothetical protein
VSGAVVCDRRDRDRDLKKAHTVSELFWIRLRGFWFMLYNRRLCGVCTHFSTHIAAYSVSELIRNTY